MKHIIKLSLLFLMIIFWGCSSHLEKKDENYTAPSLKGQPRLIYPKAAQENGFEGNSLVIVTISEKGDVEKTNIVKTSGHKVLDDAAIDYCRKLKFYPAKRGETPVNSKMEWNVKFNFKNRKWDGELYVNNVLGLYKQIEKADAGLRYLLQKSLLDRHQEFISSMKDGINFNYYIGQVISEDLLIEWEDSWDSYPLSFLLYHDFITRYKDYKEIDDVKSQLENSLLSDIYFISNTPELDQKEKQVKELLVKKVKSFVAAHYPSINIENLEIKAENYNGFISSH